LLCDFNFLARTVVITARTVINAAHNTKNLHPTATGQVKYFAKHCLKHFPHRQGVNIFVTLSLQQHWHQPSKTTLSLAPHNILTPLAKGELLLLSFAQPTIEDSSHQHRRKHFAYWQGVNNFV